MKIALQRRRYVDAKITSKRLWIWNSNRRRNIDVDSASTFRRPIDVEISTSIRRRLTVWSTLYVCMYVCVMFRNHDSAITERVSTDRCRHGSRHFTGRAACRWEADTTGWTTLGHNTPDPLRLCTVSIDLIRGHITSALDRGYLCNKTMLLKYRTDVLISVIFYVCNHACRTKKTILPAENFAQMLQKLSRDYLLSYEKKCWTLVFSTLCVT